MGDYWEKYAQDSRWQQRRLDILERDNWTCLLCREQAGYRKPERETYDVHHFAYPPNDLPPWCAEESMLGVLCRAHHEQETALDKLNRPFLWRVLRELPWTADMKEAIAGILLTIAQHTATHEAPFTARLAALRRVQARLPALLEEEG